MPINARWTGRTDPIIAEVAEALGVPTDCIMGVKTGDDLMVLYSQDVENADPDIWAAHLSRDDAGVMRVEHNSATGKTFSEFLPES